MRLTSQRACTFPILSSRKSWRQLPETNSTFLHKITWGMVKHTHMKSKKNCPAHYILFINSVELFEILQKKATFWKFAGELEKSCCFLRIFRELYGVDKEYVVCGAIFFRLHMIKLNHSWSHFLQKNWIRVWKFFEKMYKLLTPRCRTLKLRKAGIFLHTWD